MYTVRESHIDHIKFVGLDSKYQTVRLPKWFFPLHSKRCRKKFERERSRFERNELVLSRLYLHKWEHHWQIQLEDYVVEWESISNPLVLVRWQKHTDVVASKRTFIFFLLNNNIVLLDLFVLVVLDPNTIRYSLDQQLQNNKTTLSK